MRHAVITLAIAFLGLSLLVGEAPAADKPGKNAAIFDGDAVETGGFVSDLGTVTLRRFRSKRILRVDAWLEVEALFGGDLALLDGVRVNDVFVPFDSTFCNSFGCSVSGWTVVDLDELAAANPGTFKKQALTVTIRGRLEGNVVTTRNLRVLVQLIRK